MEAMRQVGGLEGNDLKTRRIYQILHDKQPKGNILRPDKVRLIKFLTPKFKFISDCGIDYDLIFIFICMPAEIWSCTFRACIVLNKHKTV